MIKFGLKLYRELVMILNIHHVSLLVKDTKVALGFYNKILGLQHDTSRPDLGYPGAWLNIGQHQIHLLELPDPMVRKELPNHGGRDRHVAFIVEDLSRLIARLIQHQIEFSQSRSGRKALFCRDPDGNALEFIQQS